MNLENIVGGTINSLGGIDRGYAEPTGFRVNEGGQILRGYNTPVARIDGCGIVRTGYNTDTGIRLTNY